MAIATVNPATGQTLRTFEPYPAAAVEQRLARAEQTFAEYRLTDFAYRARLMHRAAELLDADQETIAKLMTTEMGKPLTAARAEAAKCAKAMRWYADRAPGLLADEHPAPEDVTDSRRRAGLGALPAARGGAGRDALELPALAGDPVRRPRADGGQRRPAQARLQRPADRALPGGPVPRRRVPRGLLPDTADRLACGRRRAARPRVAAATLTGSEGAGRSVARWRATR